MKWISSSIGMPAPRILVQLKQTTINRGPNTLTFKSSNPEWKPFQIQLSIPFVGRSPYLNATSHVFLAWEIVNCTIVAFEISQLNFFLGGRESSLIHFSLYSECNINLFFFSKSHIFRTCQCKCSSFTCVCVCLWWIHFFFHLILKNVSNFHLYFFFFSRMKVIRLDAVQICIYHTGERGYKKGGGGGIRCNSFQMRRREIRNRLS